jgi:hypothetical protein
MKMRMKHAIAIGAAIWSVPMTQAVAGIDVQAGDWKLDFSGNANGFYVDAICDHGTNNTSVNGGLACVGDNSSSVRNGLLPGALVFSATTRQEDIDINVTIGFYPGINSTDEGGAGANNGGNPRALGTPGIDARQTFLTFGDASWGTVKIGRDIGLFGKDAILDDMTLLGVGTASGNAAPGNTSLGRIGLGYIYTDWEPQVTYTTASFGGFSASFGVFQPLDAIANGTPTGAQPTYTSHNTPQFQVGVAFAWGDPKSDALTGKVWVDGVTQHVAADRSVVGVYNYDGIATDYNGTAVDGGVKVDVAGFEAVLYGYSGKGVGTTGLYLYGASDGGEARKSDGGYVQLTYKFDKLKLGASYGISELKLAGDENQQVAGVYVNDVLKRNASAVGGVYYSLTKSVTLVGEFIDTKATDWNGNEATEKDIALGGILFF